LIVGAHAQTPYASVEAESGTLSNGATTETDSTASGGTYVKFGSQPTGSGNVAQFFISDNYNSGSGNATTQGQITATQAESFHKFIQLQYSPTIKTLVDAIHVSDPGVKVLMYADPTGDGGFTAGVASNGCVSGDTGGDAWLLYDGTTQDSGDTNLGDTNFDNTCIDNAMTQAASADFDGVFWDEMVNVSDYKVAGSAGNCINAYEGSDCSIYDGDGDESGWQSNTEVFLGLAGAYDTAHNMLSIINDSGLTTSGWDAFGGVSGITGQMEENFVHTIASSFPAESPTQWLEVLENESWSEAHDSVDLAMSYSNTATDEAGNTYGLATMLLAANGYTSYSSQNGNGQYPTYTFWPEYTAAENLGAPQGAYTTVSGSSGLVYERKFANGMVIVNPQTGSSGSISLGGTYSGPSGGDEPTNVSSVTLAAQSGMILTD